MSCVPRNISISDEMVLLKKYKRATGEGITKLTLDKLPDVLDEKQKQNRIKTYFMQCQKLTEVSKKWAHLAKDTGELDKVRI